MARRKCAIGKYKRVLEVDPESLESILPLTQIEETEAEDADSSILLSREDWEKLIQIIKGQVDRLDQPKNKLLAYQNLAEIYEF